MPELPENHFDDDSKAKEYGKTINEQYEKYINEIRNIIATLEQNKETLNMYITENQSNISLNFCSNKTDPASGGGYNQDLLKICENVKTSIEKIVEQYKNALLCS